MTESLAESKGDLSEGTRVCKADGSEGEMPRLAHTGVRWAQLPEPAQWGPKSLPIAVWP